MALNKKMIVTVNLKDLTEDGFRKKVKSMSKAQTDNPTYVPGLDPPAAAVDVKSTDLDKLYVNRDALNLEQMENTKKINAARNDITNIITDDWAPQTQKACAGAPEKVVALGFGIKGEYDGQAEPAVSITNSKPDIADVDLNRELEHTLTIKNNVTGKIGLPEDVKRLDVYISFGETEPVSLKNMTFSGSASRGKYTQEFTPEQRGQEVWYTAIYIGKKKGSKGELASKVKWTVV